MSFKTFVSGAVLTAAEQNTYLMNQSVIVCTAATRPSAPVEGMRIAETDTDLEYIYTGSAWLQVGNFGAFQTWTPTLTQSATVTKTVLYSTYYRAGRLIVAQCDMQVTGAGTANNAVTIGLPVAASNAGSRTIGVAHVYDASVPANYSGNAVALSTTTVTIMATGTAVSMGQTGAPFAAALGSSDNVTMSVTYEAAS